MAGSYEYHGQRIILAIQRRFTASILGILPQGLNFKFLLLTIDSIWTTTQPLGKGAVDDEWYELVKYNSTQVLLFKRLLYF